MVRDKLSLIKMSHNLFLCRKMFVTLPENMKPMEDVKAFRQKILDILLSEKDGDGNQRLPEAVAISLANELSDQELLDGMDFNTPEEVAELLLESGL